MGTNPRIGGLRDPNNYWDFYDVPSVFGARDGEIGLVTDILGVLDRLGTHDDFGRAIVNRDSDQQAPPEDFTSYHPAFDRSMPLGETQYSLGPPDGYINLWDVLGVLAQFGHSCRG